MKRSTVIVSRVSDFIEVRLPLRTTAREQGNVSVSAVRYVCELRAISVEY